MTDISEIFIPAPTLSTPEYTNTDSSAEVMGKDDFLTLLVAQLQNQDPMNPDDPTEFTAQLAQFSSLEQLFNINESMETLASTQQQSDRFSTMDIIGKEVIYADNNFTFAGEPTNIGYQLDGSAASVSMAIRDANGSTVASLTPTELTPGNHFIAWDGLDSKGKILPDGKYTISLQATSAGEGSTVAVSPLVQSEVTGVDFSQENGEASLYTLAGATIGTSSIIAVYQPDSLYNKTLSAPAESDATEDEEESLIDQILSLDGTGTSPSSSPTESASTDEEQIEQESLQYFLAG